MKRINFIIIIILILISSCKNKELDLENSLKIEKEKLDLENNLEIEKERQDFENILGLKVGESRIFGPEEYSKIYYNLAIESQTKPKNFRISENIALEMFKAFVQEYYDILFTENITIREYEEYYIITGNENDKIMGDIIAGNNRAVTLILNISDGTVISFFMEI